VSFPIYCHIQSNTPWLAPRTGVSIWSHAPHSTMVDPMLGAHCPRSSHSPFLSSSNHAAPGPHLRRMRIGEMGQLGQLPASVIQRPAALWLNWNCRRLWLEGAGHRSGADLAPWAHAHTLAPMEMGLLWRNRTPLPSSIFHKVFRSSQPTEHPALGLSAPSPQLVSKSPFTQVQPTSP
jgi:hypothetical protein